jgi:signal transduction histidine kinase
VIRTGQPKSREWELELADGVKHLFTSTKFPVSDSNGVTIGVGTIGMDISDLRAAELQLRQAQKMEAVGQLTGGIAHDFNNLLAIMMGNLSLLREDLGPENAASELLEPTMRAIDQAADMTARMLAFSRQQPLTFQQVDANELLRGMQPLIKRSLVEDIDIEFIYATELSQCYVDPGQLEQAILNLSINARDAMPRGGRLRIETAEVSYSAEDKERPIDLSPGVYVVIAVSDDGAGIPDKIVERIFDPFFTTKSVGEGTGLGLSMVYGFVKQSNGHITVNSTQGAGTTFRMYLTTEGDRQPVDGVTVADVVAAANSESILVVEDDVDVQAMISLVLTKQGYEVFLAEDGRQGLAVIADNPKIDLLLTDILLPGGMNGQQMAHAATTDHGELKCCSCRAIPGTPSCIRAGLITGCNC